MPSGETPIYRETQQSAFRIPLVILITAILLFGAWQARDQHWQSVLIVGFAILMGGVVWGLTQLTSEVTATEFRFGFALWRKRIPLERVIVGDIEDIPLSAGIGIHIWRGRWIFNARAGRGLVITVGKTVYHIGSDNPERLQAALLTATSGRRTR